MTIDDMIAVLQAAKAGKAIEMQVLDGTWSEITTPSWDFNRNNYRVKPEPREWFVRPTSNGEIVGFPGCAAFPDSFKVREVLE